MGSGISRADYLREQKEALENRITLRFPGFKETDKQFLETQAAANKAFSHISYLIKKLASFTGLPKATEPILTVINSAFLGSSLKSAMLAMKIETAVVNTVQPLLEAEMKSVARQLKLISDEEISRKKKKTYLAIADHTCYQLLVKFSDSNFYLKKYPLVFAPFLMYFVSVYVPIALANCQVVGSRRMREECEANMEELKDVVIYFKEHAVKERLKFIGSCHPIDEYPFVSDDFLTEGRVLHVAWTLEPNILKELLTWYRDEITNKYEDFFQPGLEALEELDF